MGSKAVSVIRSLRMWNVTLQCACNTRVGNSASRLHFTPQLGMDPSNSAKPPRLHLHPSSGWIEMRGTLGGSTLSIVRQNFRTAKLPNGARSMKVRDSSNLHSPYAKALLSRPKPQRSRSRRQSCLPPTKPAADEEDEEESYFLADECPSTPWATTAT